MDILLESNVLKVTKINSKTKAKMFKDLKVGDCIILSIPIERAGSNRGTYASYIKAVNVFTADTTYNSFNQLPRLLENFEFEQLIEEDLH